jgi:hypothetical protein
MGKLDKIYVIATISDGSLTSTKPLQIQHVGLICSMAVSESIDCNPKIEPLYDFSLRPRAYARTVGTLNLARNPLYEIHS